MQVPDAVLDVHRRYVRDRVRRDLDQHLGAAQRAARRRPAAVGEHAPGALDGRRPARPAAGARGVELEGRAGECAVAFSLNGEVDSPEGQETIRLLATPLEEEPPDLILVETLSLVGPSIYVTVETLLETGLPVWLSFRRCRHGVCGVYGQHWGGPEGDLFGRAARRFEEMGVGALLVNCIPPDHVAGMVSWLRDFTDMPLGVYPNLGYHTNDGWRFDQQITGEAYAEMALAWREEGAQIIGGCCGVGPELIGAARERLPTPSRATAAPSSWSRRTAPASRRPRTRSSRRAGATSRAATCSPCRCPRSPSTRASSCPRRAASSPGSTCSTSASATASAASTSAVARGILTVQLALNGAAHVHAIDIDEAAVAEHARERVPQRRGRPRQRGRRRPLPVGARGALRADRREPLPDARSTRPSRSAPTARSTTGAATCSTT